jgi:uncharacterized membrane protein
MTWLIIGIALWIAAHVFKRVAPGARVALQERMGNASKGLIAAVLLLSVVLMVLGYRAADFISVWAPPVWAVHVNNLLMVLAVVLFGIGNSKSRLRGKLRHPMLIGFATWCVAHLLVNGDIASIVMWGVLLVWALWEMRLINAADPAPAPYEGGTVAGDVRLGLISLVVFVVIVALHGWLGPWPLGG